MFVYHKKILIIIGVIVLFIFIGAGYFLFAGRSVSKPPIDQNQSVIDGTPENLLSSDIGLTLVASPNKKQVKFSINKLSGIKAVEYQISYEGDSTKEQISEGGDLRIQRGVTGEAKYDKGDGSYESSWIDLGSCSKNVCRYDTGVESVTFLFRITKDNGRVYQVEDKLDL